mgnify:CR=1 FL=1
MNERITIPRAHPCKSNSRLRAWRYCSITAAFLVTIFSNSLSVKAAGAKRFHCGTSSGVPATLATTASGKTVPVIRWTSTTFDSAGWSQNKRCQAVSQRFEQYRQEGRLKYLTTGRMNGQAVICSANKDGGSCNGLLYTLKPGQDPTKTLRDLLVVRTKAAGPLNETTSRLYVKMGDLLDAATGETTPASSVTSKPASSTTTTPAAADDNLW